MRGNGERIGPQNLPTSSVAGGIWNLLNQQRAQQRGAWPSATPAVVTDPYFMYVPLLLNTTSTNAQQNNTFLDSSSNAFTITRNGTPTQGAFTPYQPSGYWSGYFPSSSYLSVPYNAALNLVSGDFTIETWFYCTALTASYQIILDKDGVNGAAYAQYGFSISSTGILGATLGNGAGLSPSLTDYGNSTPVTLNMWNHVAMVRTGTTIKVFLNGAQINSTPQVTAMSDGGKPLLIGYQTGQSSAFYFNGYVSNTRIVKGTAVYTSAFTPSTTPLTAITNTSLLTLQSNRFIDNGTANSGSGFPITVNGTPKIQAFQPFAPAASYSAATYGGSGLFSSSYLALPTSASGLALSNSDFTVEAWVFRTSGTTTACVLIGQGDLNSVSGSSYVFYVNGASNSDLYVSGSTFGITSPNPTLNTWSHVAWVRTGGTYSSYLNGTRVGTRSDLSTSSVNAGFTTYAPTVGGFSTSINFFNGYISNLRLIKGSGGYDATSATITVPTTPVTAVSGTSLLINFTNAGIYDAAWQNNALTVGDAQVSTTQAQWPTTSMKFDGTLDALSIPPSTSFGLGTGDWTIEFWLYLNSVPSANITLVSMLTSDTSIAPHIYYANGGGVTYYTNSANRISGSALSATTWYYIALTKASGSTKLYINGTQSGATYTDTNNYGTSNPFAVADYKYPLSGLSPLLNGYVQDVRITKGVARTITTPTAAFPTR